MQEDQEGVIKALRAAAAPSLPLLTALLWTWTAVTPHAGKGILAVQAVAAAIIQAGKKIIHF